MTIREFIPGTLVVAKEKKKGNINNYIPNYERGYKWYPIWKTKDGQRLKIKEMQTSHIENCIRCLKNGSVTVTKKPCAISDPYGETIVDYSKDYIEAFQNELRRRKNSDNIR